MSESFFSFSWLFAEIQIKTIDNLFPSPPYLNPTIPPGDLGSDPEDNRNKDTSKSASKECPAVDLHPDDDGVVGDNDQVVYYGASWF